MTELERYLQTIGQPYQNLLELSEQQLQSFVDNKSTQHPKRRWSIDGNIDAKALDEMSQNLKLYHS